MYQEEMVKKDWDGNVSGDNGQELSEILTHMISSISIIQDNGIR